MRHFKSLARISQLASISSKNKNISEYDTNPERNAVMLVPVLFGSAKEQEYYFLITDEIKSQLRSQSPNVNGTYFVCSQNGGQKKTKRKNETEKTL